MGRTFALAAALAALAGCYNPRFPSEISGERAVPQEVGNSQETSVRERDRRDSAAGSGSSRSY